MKAGDVVMCVDAWNGRGLLEEAEVYEVVEFRPNFAPSMVSVIGPEISTLVRGPAEFWASRFEVVGDVR